MQQNGASGLKTGLLEEFMDVTFGFSEEELQAVHGIIPMTQDIYDRCAQKCEELGAVQQLEELIAEFQVQYRSYRGRQENPCEDSGETQTNFPEAAKRNHTAGWEKSGDAKQDGTFSRRRNCSWTKSGRRSTHSLKR